MIHVTDLSDKNVVGRLGEGCLRLLLRGGLPLHSQTLASFSYSVHTLWGTIERNHSHGREALVMSPAATSAGQLGPALRVPGRKEEQGQGNRAKSTGEGSAPTSHLFLFYSQNTSHSHISMALNSYCLLIFRSCQSIFLKT